MSRFRVALKKTKGILDRVDQWPVELEQLATSPAGKDEPRQRSAGYSPTLRQLIAKLREADRLIASDLGETGLQGIEGIGV